MPAFLKKRDNILVLAFGLVLVFFIGRMLQMQLIQGDEYESQIYKGTIKTQTVEAARGEITDRYGNPIVTNRVSMNIVLDKAFLPAETQNEIILSLMQLLEQELHFGYMNFYHDQYKEACCRQRMYRKAMEIETKFSSITSKMLFKR